MKPEAIGAPHDRHPLVGGDLRQDALSCGWHPVDHAAPAAVLLQTFQGPHWASLALLQSDRGRRLFVLEAPEFLDAEPSALMARFVNLSMETRMALAVAECVGQPDWFLWRTRQRIELYRLPYETCELRIDSDVDYRTELLPALAALAAGCEGFATPSPHRLPESESLGEWLQLWTMQLAAALRAPTDSVQRMLWKWLILLQADRWFDPDEALRGWGLRLTREGEPWSAAFDAPSAVAELDRAIERFDERFRTALFGWETEIHRTWVRTLEETALLDRLRAEMLLHARFRLAAESVAWLFTDLEREQPGWQRELMGVEPVLARLRHDGWCVHRPLVCDVGRFGLLAALRDLERLAAYLDDLNRFMQHHRNQRRGPAAMQPDLFAPPLHGIGADGLLDDGINYLLGSAVRLRGVPPEERFGVGVTVLLHAMALAQRLGWPLRGIDTLDAVFEETS